MKQLAKQISALALAGILLLLCALPAGAASVTILLGDADRNGEIGVEDARYVLRCSVGLEIYDGIDDLICDVDENGYIEVDDARLILRAAVGLEEFGGKSYTVDDHMGGGLVIDPGFTGHTGNYFLSEAEKTDNARLIYKILADYGWSKNAICATLGNLEQESTLNPGIKQTYGSGFGLAQWTPGTHYTNWAAKNGYPNDSIEGQLYFLNWTMRPDCPWESKMWYRTTLFPLSYEEFISSDAAVAYLTEAFMREYERPGIPHLDRRVAYAEKWLAYFSGLGF